MTWPIDSDYQEAIQHPKRCFQDPDLKEGQVRVDRLGLPQAITGNFAIVFEVTSPNKQRWAVKCFTREVPRLQERYRAISEYLRSACLPYTVDFQYLDSGILVRGRWYPILKMHWVQGETLREFVKNSLNCRSKLEALAQDWLRLAQDLRDHHIGHGDLQHGNVLMVPGSEAPVVFLRLVDYDGMYVPALAQIQPAELGHPNYQHPEREQQGYYGPDVDRFPHLVIYTALRGLIVDPTLWETFDKDDNLLFTWADFEQPRDSRLFHQLWELPDANIRHLVGHLLLSAVRPITATPWLTELVRDGQVRPLSREDQKAVQHYLEPRPPLPSTNHPSSGDIFEVDFAVPPFITPTEDEDFEDSEDFEDFEDFEDTLAEDELELEEPPSLPSSRTPSRGLPSWLSRLAPSTAAPPPPPPPPPPGSSPDSWIPASLSRLGSRLQAVLKDRKWRRAISLGGGLAAVMLLAYGIGYWQGTHTAPSGNAEAIKSPAPGLAQTPTLNQSPTVAILGTDPVEPVAGQPFTIHLQGSDPDGDALSFEYRRVGESRWQAAPQGQVRFDHVEPGVLELEFRSLDSRGTASRPIRWVWQVSSEVRRFTGHTNGVNSVAFSPDGRFVLSGSWDEMLRLWEVESGQEVRQFTGHSGDVRSVAFSPDGRYVLSGSSDKTLRLWEVATGQEVRRFTRHTGWVTSVAFSPDGRYVLSGSDDQALRLWDVATGQEVRRFTGHTGWVNSVAFSPDGRYVLSGSYDQTLRLWEVATGQEVRRFTGHTDWVKSVAFSPDGRFVLSGSEDQALRLWEVATGQEVHRFTGHTGGVWSVAFSPDGRYVLSGSYDQTLRLWLLPKEVWHKE